jgi:hypothetical protein
MWKKVLWVYLAIYLVGVVVLAAQPVIDGEPISSLLMGLIVMLIPAGVLAFELREGKAPNIITAIILVVAYLVGFLFLAIATVGNFTFNDMNLATIGKGLVLIPMLVCLIYFGFRRIFRKRA